jgi:hypothetical protein
MAMVMTGFWDIIISFASKQPKIKKAQANLMINMRKLLKYYLSAPLLNLQNPLVQKEAVWVYYEDLVMKPEAEVKRILHETGLEEECPAVLENAEFRKPSQTDFKQQLLNSPEEQLWKNLNRLSEEEKAGIQRIFDRYHLKRYSAYHPFPAGRNPMEDLPKGTTKP